MRATAVRLGAVLLVLAACTGRHPEPTERLLGDIPGVWAVTDMGGVARAPEGPCSFVRVRYPRLVEGPATEPVNEAIRAAVREETGPWSESCRPPPDGVSEHLASVTSDFDQVRLDDRVASFRVTFSHDGYLPRSIDTVHTFNYDLTTGRPIRLEDLFRRGLARAGLGVMSAAARRLLRAQLGDAYDRTHVETGTSPASYNFGAFVLADHALEVTFQPYQVASFAGGTPTVSIPARLLAPFLRPSVPLG